MRKRRVSQDWRWPSWRYGPNGEAQIFQKEADVPLGWTKKPGEIYVPKPSTVLDRSALITELEAKGVVVKGTWSSNYMKELLS